MIYQFKRPENRIKHSIGGVFLTTCRFASSLAPAHGSPQASDELESLVLNPPDSPKLLVGWHWMRSNLSKSGITRDLEAMKVTGIGGATGFNISSAVRESHAPTLHKSGPAQTYRSPAHWDALRFSAAEADRLGLEIGLHNTVGYATTGGRWIDEERGMEHLVWSNTLVTGGSTLSLELSKTDFKEEPDLGQAGRAISFYNDIAVPPVPADQKEISPGDLVQISSIHDPEGGLEWNAPPGEWNVYRMGHAAPGSEPHPVADESIRKVMEVDRMSADRNSWHWKNVIDPVKAKLGGYIGKLFRHMLIDSDEAGGQNRTPGLREEVPDFDTEVKQYANEVWCAGDVWHTAARAQVLLQATDRFTPVAVQQMEGSVESAEALLADDGRSARLTDPEGGTKPIMVLDFAVQSVGGCAVFKVTPETGQPVLRVTYACHPDGTGENCDFTRETSARCMGPLVDLPVLPTSINRHETYAIPRTGVFIAPLIQGQARYARVQPDRLGTSVDIDSVVMVNRKVHDRSRYDGLFLSWNEEFKRLRHISAWTCQVASFANHEAWRAVDGWLLPRKLGQAADIGLSVDGADWGDVTIETMLVIRANPHHVSAAGLTFRARDAGNASMVELALDGTFRLIKRENGQDQTLSAKTLASPLTDGIRYRLKVEAKGDLITTRLGDVMVDETRDATFPSGRVGFYTPNEKWPLFEFIRVRDHRGGVLLEDDFTGDLSRWEFARTRSFVSDGAKRDRLVWSADLYFAQRNEYYAMPNAPYMRDSLKMLAFNQTPEGYVQACPYPERNTPPASGEYGPFACDEFAAWLVPVAWDHMLYTDDVETLREIYPVIGRFLAYLEKYIGADGLFIQRHETSKQAGDLKLGNTKRRAYMNILCWGAFSDAAKIADRLGHADAAAAARARADKIKAALFQLLWDGEKGGFHEAIETPRFGPEANALALSMGLLTQEQAARVVPRMPMIKHGKFQGLASRGMFRYGFGQRGLKMIYDHNWLKLLDPDWKGATTTTECMFMLTRGWFDESHPDTAIGYQFSSYILGVEPLAPGFRRFQVRPMLVSEVDWARGRVPTPHGFVEAGWKRDGNNLTMQLTAPKGTEAELVLPKGEAVLVNGRKPAAMLLGAGRHEIEVRGLMESADLIETEVKDGVKAVRKVTASSSHEKGGWSAAHLFAPEADAARLGYSSAAHSQPEVEVWVAMDLGEDLTPKEIVLLPRRDKAAADGLAAGFPRDFVVEIATEPNQYKTVAEFKDQAAPDEKGLAVNLYTVIGYPKVRYIRIRTTKLGAPAADEPDSHRLQLRRVRVVPL